MLGADGVLWDRFSRQCRIDDTARRCFDTLDADTQRWCALRGRRQRGARRRPRGGPEFEEPGTAPDRGSPWTPLGVFLVQHILFATFPNKLWRAHVARTLGPDAVALFSIEAPVWSGSNAWAVTAGRPRRGAPLIAGDPHRLIELPGVYQQVRLACPEFDVVGFAFPGVPGLPHFGHAGDVAWAITNAMADYQDLYDEELRRSADGGSRRAAPSAGNRRRGRRDDPWSEAARPRTVEVVETARGPVIAGGPDGGALSLRVPARVEGRLGFDALLPLLREPPRRRRGGGPAAVGGAGQQRGRRRHRRRPCGISSPGWCRSGTTTTGACRCRQPQPNIPGTAAMWSCRGPAWTVSR